VHHVLFCIKTDDTYQQNRMLHTAPRFHKSYSESSLTFHTDRVSCGCGNVGIFAPNKAEKACGHVLNEFHSASQSTECHIWEMEALEIKHENLSTPVEHDYSVLHGILDVGVLFESAIFDLVNDNGGADDPSTKKIESEKNVAWLELLESSVKAYDQHRAWLDQRRYRAWLGARNLHIK
jgi:hypothetical protein